MAKNKGVFKVFWHSSLVNTDFFTLYFFFLLTAQVT